MKKVFVLQFVFVLLLIASCENEKYDNLNLDEANSSDYLYIASGILEVDSKEKVRNAVLEMIELVKIIKKDYPLAYEELSTLLKSDFYAEPYIGLNEILEPNNSLIYRYISINNNLIGKFSESFKKITSNQSNLYPNLIEVSKRKRSTTQNFEKNLNQDFDLNFYDVATIAFYAPYIEDLNDIEFDIDEKLTLVPAVVDSNNGLGYKEQNDASWTNTVVDDDYAENNFTIIVQPHNYFSPCQDYNISAEIAPPIFNELTNFGGCFASNPGGVGPGSGGVSNPVNYPIGNQYTGDCEKLEPGATNPYVRQVFIGHAKINNKKQYDKLISFTGNCGGSEIRIGRLDSRDQIDIDSLGNISANQWDRIVQVYFSRKDIRKKRRKWVGSIWHNNWECNSGDHEVLLGIWEEDTEGDIIFDQEIVWEGEELFSVDATIQNRSKDEIITKFVREEDEFFATNLLDQGCGDWHGYYSFDDRDWAIYDCGTNFVFTMPHRWVPLN